VQLRKEKGQAVLETYGGNLRLVHMVERMQDSQQIFPQNK